VTRNRQKGIWGRSFNLSSFSIMNQQPLSRSLPRLSRFVSTTCSGERASKLHVVEGEVTGSEEGGGAEERW